MCRPLEKCSREKHWGCTEPSRPCSKSQRTRWQTPVVYGKWVIFATTNHNSHSPVRPQVLCHWQSCHCWDRLELWYHKNDRILCVDSSPCDSKFGSFKWYHTFSIKSAYFEAVSSFTVFFKRTEKPSSILPARPRRQGTKRIGSPTCGRPGPFLGASFEVLSRMMRNNAADDGIEIFWTCLQRLNKSNWIFFDWMLALNEKFQTKKYNNGQQMK